MSKIEIYTLDNGLKLIFYQDRTKHIAVANLFVKFGGNNKEFKINDKKHQIREGVAHFLEHLLIEKSTYGVVINEFSKNHTISNGFTNKFRTEFYINSICNFEDDLVKLINFVNVPNFNQDDVADTRHAIIKEKMMKKDDKFLDLFKTDYECLFSKIKYHDVLGEIDDIKNISYDELKLCHDTFYQPSNQILIISGNFNKNKIKKLVEETYKKIDNKNTNFEIISPSEPDEINILEHAIKKDINMPYVRINYKINISKFNNYERVKLSFYIDYFLKHLFSSSSHVYNNLVKDKICMYDIDYSCENLENYLIIRIGTYTDKMEKFINVIKNTVYNRELDEEEFTLQKKKSIINLILREDSLFGTLEPFIDNIITFNYFDIDKIEDIENQNFDDYKNMIDSLDFSHYCITKMIGKD